MRNYVYIYSIVMSMSLLGWLLCAVLSPYIYIYEPVCTRTQPKSTCHCNNTLHPHNAMPPRTTSLISALYTYLAYTRDYWGRNFKCHRIRPCIHRTAPFYLCGRKINGVLNLIQISFILVYHNMSVFHPPQFSLCQYVTRSIGIYI